MRLNRIAHTAESLLALVKREALGMPQAEKEKFTDALLTQLEGFGDKVSVRMFENMQYRNQIEEHLTVRPKKKSAANRSRNERIRRESKRWGGTKSIGEQHKETGLARSTIQDIIKTPPVRKQ